MRISLREPVNGLTHLAGAILSTVGFVVLLVIALENRSARQVVAFSIFGASLVAMYCASAFYHSLKLSERGVAHLRRGRLGLGLLIAVWSLAAAGALQTIAWMHAPEWLSTALYIGMGWIALLVIRPLLAAAPLGFFYWILAGGIIYTIGAVIHAVDWPRVRDGAARRVFGSHEIWHLCVMAGSFAHYWAIFAYASKVR